VHKLKWTSQSVSVSETAIVWWVTAQTVRHHRRLYAGWTGRWWWWCRWWHAAVNVSQFNYNCRYTNASSSTVLRDWLECSTTGQRSKFNLVADLENFVVSCQRCNKQQSEIFNHSDQHSRPRPRTQNHRGRGQEKTSRPRSRLRSRPQARNPGRHFV